MFLARPKSMVANAADGTDVVMGSAFTYGRYRDCPRSQPPLAAEHNLNSERTKEGLRPAQPASECAGLGQLDRLVPAYKRSDAVPVHCTRSVMSSRTWAATGSASTMFSIASHRLFE